METNLIKYQFRVWVGKLIIITIGFFLIPVLAGVVMEKNTIDRVHFTDVDGLPFQKHNEKKTIKLEEKAAYAADKSINYIATKLQNGYVFSLYEARVACYRELEKIDAIDIHNSEVQKDSIAVTPYLFIDKSDPSKGFFAWKGTILIQGKGYEFWMDEDSGRIIRIELIIGNSMNNVFEGEQQSLHQSWKKYIQNYL